MTTCLTDRVTPGERRTEQMGAAFSWFLVISLGFMPIADRILGRSTSLAEPSAVVFVGALASAFLLRKRHPWIRLVLHIYSQVMIWLSLTCVAVAAAILVLGN